MKKESQTNLQDVVTKEWNIRKKEKNDQNSDRWIHVLCTVFCMCVCLCAEKRKLIMWRSSRNMLNEMIIYHPQREGMCNARYTK